MKSFIRLFFVMSFTVSAVACGGGGGGGGGGGDPVTPPPPSSVGPHPLSLSRDNATLFTINRANGTSMSNVRIMLAGEVIQGGRGMAASPITDELFAVLSVDDAGNIRRVLVSIDPDSGMATQIGTGSVGRAAALVFDTAGTLYSGESANTGAGFANRLFILDTFTGERTEFMQIANSEGGIALALNPLDGQIYHLSGSIIFGDDVGTPLLEKIDTTTMTRTAIPLSGASVGHVRAMTFGPDGNFLVIATYEQYGPSDTSGRILRLTPEGEATFLGSMNHISKGVAFAPPILTVGVNSSGAACKGINECSNNAVTHVRMAQSDADVAAASMAVQRALVESR